MPNYQINSPTILFKHNEYGARLLFQNGISNPRDELGTDSLLHNTVNVDIMYIINRATKVID